MYVRRHVHIWTFMYIWMYACTNVRIMNTYARMYVYLFSCMVVCLATAIYVHTYTLAEVCLKICILFFQGLRSEYPNWFTIVPGHSSRRTAPWCRWCTRASSPSSTAWTQPRSFSRRLPQQQQMRLQEFLVLFLIFIFFLYIWQICDFFLIKFK